MMSKYFARILRKNPMDAERTLWRYLRMRQMGAKFRRQQRIGRYIADFACLERKLIIELDGGQHAEETRAHDDRRTAWLRERGYRVLRFWDRDVFRNIDGVKEAIWMEIHNPRPTLAKESPRALGRTREQLCGARSHLNPGALTPARGMNPPPSSSPSRGEETRMGVTL